MQMKHYQNNKKIYFSNKFKNKKRYISKIMKKQNK